MTKFNPFFLIGLLIATMACASEGQTNFDHENLMTENYSLSPFNKLIVSGGGNVFIHRSEVYSIEIQGGGSCLDKVESSVATNTLFLSMNNNGENCQLEIHINAPSIVAIQQNGGGQITVQDDFEEVEVFKCRIDGGGMIQMRSIPVNKLVASISGGGEINAQVEDFIDGTINGGGNIYYQGEPKVISNIAGGGIIKKK